MDFKNVSALSFEKKDAHLTAGSLNDDSADDWIYEVEECDGGECAKIAVRNDRGEIIAYL